MFRGLTFLGHSVDVYRRSGERGGRGEMGGEKKRGRKEV